MSFYQEVENYIFRKITANTEFHLPNHADLGNLKIRFFDIGAADGLNENNLFLAPILDVTGFEPDQRSFENLSKILESQGIRNYKVLPFSLNREKGEVDFFLTSKATCSSMYEPDLSIAESYRVIPKFFPMEKTTTDCVKLDDQIDYADWIKLETQGSELDILNGALRVLENWAVVQTEVEFFPIYKNQPVFDEIAQFLRHRGFQVFDIKVSGWNEPYLRNSVHAVGGSKTPLFGDAVFIKEEFLPWNLNTVESEQILIVLILISYKKLGLAYSILAKAKDIGVLKQGHEDLIIEILNTRFNGFL